MKHYIGKYRKPGIKNLLAGIVKSSLLLIICILFLSDTKLFAQPKKLPSAYELKKLSVEELMEIEVTSVSKNPEKLTEVASAIQVLNSEDVRRSTATRLPEALRLAPNLQVARTTSHDWAVTARGFNAAPLSNVTLANKLLVMIDGRSIYEPLLAGVFWDVQNIFIEDLERIEIVSGPGGTLWGANAVNGVINIMSKNAKETQGLLVSLSSGNFLKTKFGSRLGARYGTHIDSTFFIRVYGQKFNQTSSTLKSGVDAKDSWVMTQGGFRSDYMPSEVNSFTLQGDFYDGRENDTIPTFNTGMNIIGRWNHIISDVSNFSLQVYFDRTYRRIPSSGFKDKLNNYDIDFQHSFLIGTNNNITWGAGYRLMDDNTDSTSTLKFDPQNRKLELYSAFVQDQISLVGDELNLTVGTKLIHNDYTKFEWQPSIRLAWTPNSFHTIWTAVSRSVRTPGRFEVDEITPTLNTPGKKFLSEKVIAYELGYRVRPSENSSISLATYYNQYDDLRSFDFNPDKPGTVIFANSLKANAWGLEISGNLVISEKFRLRGGYTFLNKKFTYSSPPSLPGAEFYEALDPNNQIMLQSILDLPYHFQLDLSGRYIDKLPAAPGISPAVPSYFTFNFRLAWEYKNYSIALMGQNMAEKTHPEFGAYEIPRSMYAKLVLRF